MGLLRRHFDRRLWLRGRGCAATWWRGFYPGNSKPHEQTHSLRPHHYDSALTIMTPGPSGTGKTLAAEALGYDLGSPLKVVNSSSLISKWVGESAKNIEAVFDDAAAAGAVLVFDEAEALFGTRGEGGGGAGRHDTANVGVLLQRIATFPGVVVAITNLRDAIDPAFDRRFSHIIEFPKPDRSLRLRLWRKLLPKECPRDDDLDEAALASRLVLSNQLIESTESYQLKSYQLIIDRHFVLPA
mmetsp:Transcript_106703/g.309507  ORF Transcript_106703/g.309507 Transcript_106703/m.309507 type:complete len:242 (+) Transcript_106703:270-995(+)